MNFNFMPELLVIIARLFNFSLLWEVLMKSSRK